MGHSGNHIDAWTYGGVDPNSGTTALLEVAAGLGRLLADGFGPKRSLVLAAWGGEEYGLIGSTEWGEDFQTDLMEKAICSNLDPADRRRIQTPFSSNSVERLD